jgi:hypothetical protein
VFTTVELKIVRLPIFEAPLEVQYPVPIPEPQTEVALATVELKSVRSPIFEAPLDVQHPVPIPEPASELLASTREFEINNIPTDEFDCPSCDRPVPIPEPSLESAIVIIVSQITALSIVEIPPEDADPVPIPEQSAKLLASTCDPEINNIPTRDPQGPPSTRTPSTRPVPIPDP